MQIPKPSEDDKEFFRSLVPPAAGVRLDDAASQELAAVGGRA